MQTVWIVLSGTLTDSDNAEFTFHGVYSTEEKALAACLDERYGVGPATVDAEMPTVNVDWPGFYYPYLRTAH